MPDAPPIYVPRAGNLDLIGDGNYAPLTRMPPAVSGQEVRASRIAPSDGVTNATTFLQLALDTATSANPIRLIVDKGTVLINGLDASGNTKIEIAEGATLRLANNSNRPPIRNKHPTTPSSRTIVDENITICGGGTLDCNGENQLHHNAANGNEWSSGIALHGVRNVRIFGIKITRPATFAIHLSNWLYVWLDSLNIDVVQTSGYNFDGSHFNGPGRWGWVTNCVFYTFDDAGAFNTDEPLVLPPVGALPQTATRCFGPYGFPGAINDVQLSDNFLADSNFGFRFLDAKYGMNRIGIRGLRGRTTNQGFVFDCYGENNLSLSEPGPGNFGTITIEDIDLAITSAGYKSAHVFANAFIKQLILRKMVRSDFSANVPLVKIGAATGDINYTNVGMLDIDGVTQRNTHATNRPNLIEMSAHARVNWLSTRNMNLQLPIGLNGGGYVLNMAAGATVDNWTRDNVNYSGMAGLTAGTGTIGTTTTGGVNLILEANPWTVGSGIAVDSDTGVTYNPVNGTPQIAKYNPAPGVTDYATSARVNFGATVSNGSIVGLLARATTTTSWSAAVTYVLYLTKGTGVSIGLANGGAYSTLSLTVGATALAGATDYDATLVANGTTLSGRVRRVSDGLYLQTDGTWGSTAVYCVTATSSTITAAGAGGIIFYSVAESPRVVTNFLLQ